MEHGVLEQQDHTVCLWQLVSLWTSVASIMLHYPSGAAHVYGVLNVPSRHRSIVFLSPHPANIRPASRRIIHAAPPACSPGRGPVAAIVYMVRLIKCLLRATTTASNKGRTFPELLLAGLCQRLNGTEHIERERRERERESREEADDVNCSLIRQDSVVAMQSHTDAELTC